MTQGNVSDELRRLAGDLARVCSMAVTGIDPRSTPEYVAAMHVVPATARRLNELLVQPIRSDELDSILAELSAVTRQLRDLTLAGGKFGEVLARLYSPEYEEALSSMLARRRSAAIIRTSRTERNMTLKQVAQAVHATAGYISQLEFGRSLPTTQRAGQLDEVLGLVGHPNALVHVLNELRRDRDQIRRDSELLAQMDTADARPVLGPGFPPQALDALTEWKGRWDHEDLRALSLLAWQPQMRNLVNNVSQLPPEIQQRALEFVRSLAQLKVSQAGRTKASYDPASRWEAERGLVELRKWPLPILVMEFRQQFNPFWEEASPEGLGLVVGELSRRGFDPPRIARGPLLRRTARLVVERLRVAVAKASDEQRLPPALTDWIADNPSHTAVSLTEMLWSHWASLDLAEAQQHPAPPAVLLSVVPERDHVVEWFFVRTTEGSLRNWPRHVLDFEMRLQRRLVEAPLPWSSAAATWEIDLSEVDDELGRRDRAAMAVVENELPSEFVAQSLLGSGYEAFVAGRLTDAEAFARAAVERYPTVAAAYNNLGFVLLVRGVTGQALDQFGHARQLEFEDRAVLEFNVACCEYRLGNFARALEGFRSVLSVPADRSILCLVNEDNLIPLDLPSPAQFVQVAALNAAWSAHRLGSPSLPTEYLRIASSRGDVDWDSDPIAGWPGGNEAFERSRRRLAELVGDA